MDEDYVEALGVAACLSEAIWSVRIEDVSSDPGIIAVAKRCAICSFRTTTGNDDSSVTEKIIDHLMRAHNRDELVGYWMSVHLGDIIDHRAWALQDEPTRMLIKLTVDRLLRRRNS